MIPNPRLEVRDLRLILALTDGRTTAQAAKVLHLAQPSVSRALLALEERLDVPLFERAGRGLVPTTAALQIAARARALLEELANLERQVRTPKRPRRPIRIVCECYTAYHWLPSTLQALRADLTDLDLRIQVEHTMDPLAALAAQQVDAALVTSPCTTTTGLKVRPLLSDEIVFVVAKTHPLAARETLTPIDLEQAPLFAQNTTAAESRWFMRTVFGRRRPQLDITLLPMTEAVVDFARAGMGIAVLTEWVMQPYVHRGGYVAKRLRRGPIRRPWRLAWRPELGEVGPQLHRALRSSTAT